MSFYAELFETASRNTYRPITRLSFSQRKSAHLWHCIKLAIHFKRPRAMSIPCVNEASPDLNLVLTYWSLGYLSYKSNHKYDVRVLGGKLIEDVLLTLSPCNVSGDVRTLVFLAGWLANFPLVPGTKPDLVMRCLACTITHIDIKRSAFDILDMDQTQRPKGQQNCLLIL